MKVTWQPSANFLAQSCHLGWGAFAVSASLFRGLPWLIPVLVIVAAIKEFWADIFWLESGHTPVGELASDTWQGSTLDFCMYLLGGLIGWLTWWV